MACRWPANAGKFRCIAERRKTIVAQTEDPDVLAAAWLGQAQGLSVPAEAVAAPARMAARFGEIARAAAGRLVFGMEPSGFQRVFAALAKDEAGNDR